MVDSNGRELADEAPSRLMLASIDPVFNLPGKNSADIRIARDVLSDSGHDDAADVYILASGDRDFNDVLNTLIQRNQTVIVWGVRGSTSRMLENNPGFNVENIDDFTNLQTHQSLSTVDMNEKGSESFTPSQWTSVIVQFDRLTADLDTETASIRQLVEQLQDVGAVISRPRGEDLVSQAISLGILKPISTTGQIALNPNHPVVDKTRVICDRIVQRVANTLAVRNWDYVNYGFLLKGLAMDHVLDRPGCTGDDQWRSHWIDSLVRERVLERQLIPHRHNPDDLVPVIKLCDNASIFEDGTSLRVSNEDESPEDWAAISLDELQDMDRDTFEMTSRVIVSIEQFTSFRKFDWCPLGSLHKRLRAFDTGMSFQRAVEYLMAHGAVNVDEYPNPLSDYYTKGISIDVSNVISRNVLIDRDRFIQILLDLYERNTLVSEQSVRAADPNADWNLNLWFSIMETENVLNALPGRAGQYSLFRTHHTVNLVADKTRDGEGG
jgi:hypothetical protein